MFAIHIDTTKEEVKVDLSPLSEVENNPKYLVVSKCNSLITGILQKIELKTKLDYHFWTVQAYLDFSKDSDLNLVYFPLQYVEALGELKYAIKCTFISVTDTEPTSFMYASSISFEETERIVMNILTLDNRCKIKPVK